MDGACLSRKRLVAALALALGAASLFEVNAAPIASPANVDRARDPYALRLSQRTARVMGVMPHRSTPHAPADTLPVTSCLDDNSPGTLRSQIAASGEGDVIDLSALTCSTITLTQGPIDLSVLGDHHINDLSIVGPGAATLTIDGNDDRVFLHGDFQVGLGTLAISDVTIANGNYTHGLASCIDSSGNVELTRTIVTDCHASNGGPLTFGGAVSAAYLTMTSSTISDSSSSAAGDNVAIGGGAYVSGDATLVDSTISGNNVVALTPGDGTYYITAGGGLYVRGALTMTRSTVSGNNLLTPDLENGPGGGIFVRADTSIDSSTFNGNSAANGGGLYKAVFSHYGDPGTTLTITNSTFTGNGAFYGGGAIATQRPTVIESSTIAINNGGPRSGGLWCLGDDPSVELQSTILALNTYGTSGSAYDFGSENGFAVTGAANIVNAADDAITLPADTLNVDPLLESLADNGGSTRTLALGEGSPALDAGNNAAGATFDQRGEGFARESGVAADIGAFEVQQPENDRIFADGFELPAR